MNTILDRITTMTGRMKKKHFVYLLGVPVIFLITLLLLNSHLSTSGDSSSQRLHLVAAYGSQRGAFRFKPERLQLKEALDRRYDRAELEMLGIVNTDADAALKAQGDNLYAFNELISSRISLNRAIPDTRNPLCKGQEYRSDLPQASVIICFYNEAWSTLLRTVHSVLNRSPKELLFEIVLVDDASDLPHLQNKLAEYIWGLHPNITLVRLPERQGLIRARLYGAHVATGEVLVFLDSHCEVNVNWLQPLLTSVSSSKKPTIAIPVIDLINPGSFEYKGTSIMKGGFNWGMHFRWDEIPKYYFKDAASHIEPIETPTMAGGLFAVRRDMFRKMGEYDPGLDIWGGENLEISFRFWMCGGKLEIIPCSRVGHIFRSRRPYSSPDGGDSMLRNSVRVAKVWMDDYIEHFFAVKSSAASVEFGDISEREELKYKLQCKPFSWYLKMIYPEQTVPDKEGNGGNIAGVHRPDKYKPNYVKHGAIVHSSSKLCMLPETDVPKRDTRVVLADCDKNKDYKHWYETDNQELMLSEKLCLAVTDKVEKQSYAKIMKCTGMGGPQAWVWSIRNMVYQLYNPTSGKCLVPMKDEGNTYLAIQMCSTDFNTKFTMEIQAR